MGQNMRYSAVSEIRQLCSEGPETISKVLRNYRQERDGKYSGESDVWNVWQIMLISFDSLVFHIARLLCERKGINTPSISSLGTHRETKCILNRSLFRRNADKEKSKNKYSGNIYKFLEDNYSTQTNEMHIILIKSIIFNFRVFYMFRTREFNFRKTVVYAVMVSYVLHASLKAVL
jgi:hypothetical protein